jgi:hypothetical protein
VNYLDVIPAFEIGLYAFVTLLFVVAGYLNLKDLKNLKQDKWTRQDSVALALRTFFFSSFLNLMLLLLVTGVMLLTTVFRIGFHYREILPIALTSLEFSFGIFVVCGIIYGIAKWKDWYDLIDAED